jgi:hypothetical protein
VSAPAPTTDPFEIFPELAHARTALQNRDWRWFEAYHASLTSTDERLFAVSVLQEHVPDGMLAEVAAAEAATTPWSTLARTMHGWQLVNQGWEIRSAKRAKYVSREQFAEFHAHLRRAERVFIEVTALDPANAAAWAYRLTSCMGLELGEAESRRRYHLGAKADPLCVAMKSSHLQQLCEKWGGSHEKMHAFARAECAAAPPGGRAGVLVADAHQEHWLSLPRDEGTAYLRRPEVQQDLLGAGAHSVLHPAYQQRFHWIADHSLFALMFSLADNYPAAAVHFRALGPYWSKRSWSYVGDAEAAFAKHRSRALAEG